MNLPKPPDGLKVMSNVQAASVLGEWLMDVARLRGEAGLDFAIGAGWPGSAVQRKLMPESHITAARNEAVQMRSWGT
jgi:hypothetical protein